jgi:hypothetical protein
MDVGCGGLLTRVRLALLLALVLALGISSRAPHTVAGQTAAPSFSVVACPDMTWRYADPSFTALPGAKAYFGRYDGGLYRIEIPDNWNGDLILAAHGYTAATGTNGDLLSVGVDTPQVSYTFAPGLAPELRSHLIEGGFAWAASSYRCNGYVPGQGLLDTLLLKDVLLQNDGGVAPKRTYLLGLSMGGHIVDLGMQQFPQAFDGGIAYCAASAGEFDYLTAAAAAAEVVTGLQFTSLATVADTTQQMNAILGTAGHYTDKGNALGSIKIAITGGPRPFAVEGINAAFGDSYSGSALAGATDPYSASATNDFVTYGIDPGLGLTADQINASVRRVGPDWSMRGAAGPYPETKPFTGQIVKPLLTIHDTGDFFVPITQERALYQAVARAGHSDLLVQRIVRAAGHCNFSPQEVIQTFDDAVNWVENGVKPAGDDIMAPMTDAGRQFTNPLRANDPGTLSVPPLAASATPASQ